LLVQIYLFIHKYLFLNKINMCCCKYCGKEFNNQFGLMGHMRHCKLNPNYNEEKNKLIQQLASEKAAKNKINQFKELNKIDEKSKKPRKLICKKCGKEYILDLTDNQFNKGLYPKCCSSKCAHSRVHSQETKEKISQGIYKSLKNGTYIPHNQYTGKNKEQYIAKSKYLSDDEKLNYFNKENYQLISELIKEGKILNLNNYNYKDKLINTIHLHKHICVICNKEFYARIIKSGKIGGGNTCCDECHKKLKSIKSKESINKVIKEGRFQGWKSRNITSYAERFWINVLDNNNIPYIREKLFEYGNAGKGERYFLDFYIEFNNRKIDLEIDGKQHKYKERKDKDIIRDQYIKENGIEVYRIEWNEINSEQGSLKMKEKIDNFLEFIK